MTGTNLTMRIIKTIILIACIVLSVNGLHLSIMHTQSTTVASLNAVVNEIEKNVKNLQVNAEGNSQALTNIIDIQAKIKVVEQYLLLQRILLLNTYRSSLINISSITYSCPSISNEDKAFLSAFNANIARIQGEMATTTSLKEEVSNLTAVSKDCSLPIDAKSNEVSNFQSKGRIDINTGNFVNTNSNQIIKDYENQMQGGKYLITCPLQNPFTNTAGQCISCPNEKPFFNVTDSSCLACKNYNQTSRQCLQSISYFTNYPAGIDKVLLSPSQNLSDFTANKNGLPICPFQTPFSTSNSCIDCSQGLYFSLTSKTCETCPSGQFYSTSTHRCQIQLYYSNLNGLQWSTSGDIDDIMQKIAIDLSDSAYTSCPLDRPFAVNGTCINCLSDTHFSYDTLNCTACPQGLALDLNMHKCLKPGNLNFQTNPATPNLIFNGRSLNQWMNAYYREQQGKSGIVDCPATTPNFDGLSCISCPHSHPYFNLQLKVCATCEGTLRYNAEKRECVRDADGLAVQVPTWQKMAAVVFANS